MTNPKCRYELHTSLVDKLHSGGYKRVKVVKIDANGSTVIKEWKPAYAGRSPVCSYNVVLQEAKLLISELLENPDVLNNTCFKGVKVEDKYWGVVGDYGYRPVADDEQEDYRGTMLLCRISDGTVLGSDGGEPEDNTFGRDWEWIAGVIAAEVERANVKE